jgi:hypothetical protein
MNFSPAQSFGQAMVQVVAEAIEAQARTKQILDETEKIRILGDKGLLKPTEFTVLAISVVVGDLCATHFGTH